MTQVDQQLLNFNDRKSDPTSGIFAKISFGETSLTMDDTINIQCGLNTIGSEGIYETWGGGGELSYCAKNESMCSFNDETLFAAQIVHPNRSSTFAMSIERAYLDLLTLLREKGFRHIARIWNYMPQINAGADDTEVYKQFSLGRYNAFIKMGYDAKEFPAACALGHFGDSTIIYLIASKRPTRHFENPEQTSAYQYPREYGPSSPSFARATLLEGIDESTVFIAGTASITGSSSQHIDSLEQQISLTCLNIKTLANHIGSELNLEKPLQPSSFRVYLRNSEHYAVARELLVNYWGQAPSMVFTNADICRRELLFEIDAVCTVPNPADKKDDGEQQNCHFAGNE